MTLGGYIGFKMEDNKIIMKEIPQVDNMRKWLIQRHYSRLDVLFEIRNQLVNRETAFLIPTWNKSKHNVINVRYLKCHSVQYIQSCFRKFHYVTNADQEYFNFYKSVGSYSGGLPFTSLDVSQRDTDDWKKNHLDFMNAYDCFIDIDGGNHGEINHAHISTHLITKLLDDYKCPYNLIFSGCGFHIIIPYRFFMDRKFSFKPNQENSIYKKFSNIARFLHNSYTEMVDLKVYDSRRLQKVVYSLANYKRNTYVSWAFKSRLEFDNFQLDDYNIKNFNNESIRGRGITLFNGNGNVNKLLEEVNKFIEGGKNG